MTTEFLKSVEDYVIQTRHWLHQNPEVSFKEEKTSQKIQEELTKMGISFELLTPSYGVIATIKGDICSDKKIGVRADMDALPVLEETDLPFASLNEGIMHACGHDAHVAMLLGVAKILNENKTKLSGTVKLIFQAAEEAGGGIKEVIDYINADGGIDQVIGTHIWSDIPAGEILLRPEAIFAGSGRVFYKIIGKGGHGARPDLVNDPIKAACDFVTHVSSIPSNFNHVFDNAVVTICQIEGGTAGNIFPNEVNVYGTYRHFREGTYKNILDQVERMAQGIALTHDVKLEYTDDRENRLPPVYNNPEMIEKAKSLVDDIDGLVLSTQTDPICASDNYGFLLEKYKGIFAVLGGGKHGETIYPQHNSKFDIDESVLIKGTEFMTNYVLDYLK